MRVPWPLLDNSVRYAHKIMRITIMCITNATQPRGADMTVKVAVFYYSSTGTVHALAEAVAEGAISAGAEVRLRRTAELAPAEAIDQNPQWRQHLDATSSVPVA